jgi:endogenous inhibitor of DNA gyrase (YacG/DUF329 family)
MIDLGAWASNAYAIVASDENNSDASDDASSEWPTTH